MAELEEGDDGFEKKYTSMFTRASTDSDIMINGNVKRDSADDVVDGVSSKRRKSPRALGSSEENAYEEMTMAEIMMGKGDYYPGLIPLVLAYLDYIKCDSITLARVTQYLDLIQKRATGELMTPATW